MRITDKDFWAFYSKPDFKLCLFINKDMVVKGPRTGASTVREADIKRVHLTLDRNIDKRIGTLLYERGLIVFPISCDFMAFPLREHWWNPKNCAIIKKSCKQLVKWANYRSEYNYVLRDPEVGEEALSPLESVDNVIVAKPS